MRFALLMRSARSPWLLGGEGSPVGCAVGCSLDLPCRWGSQAPCSLLLLWAVQGKRGCGGGGGGGAGTGVGLPAEAPSRGVWL